MKLIASGSPLPLKNQGTIKILLMIKLCTVFFLALSVGASASPPAAPVNISGKITDERGEPLQGVSVLISGTKKGTTTNSAGEFVLTVADAKNVVLEVSNVGFQTRTVNVGSQTHINIRLEKLIAGLDNVVVVGYGVSKKATVTGSITTVKGSALEQSPATNFTNTLAGRLPGLVAVSTSGEPGNDNATIRIRGSNTLGDNSPLVVIDGVANRSMTGLNPADIESVTVLKDASAAIYGAQAANGVILITTKRGSMGKPQVNINMNYGLSKPTVLPKMADAATYATMINEIDSYNRQPADYTPEQIQKFRDGSDPWLYPNTDWFGQVFKPISEQKSGDISIRGGTESMKYFISGGFKKQDAIYRNSNAGFSQANFRANIDGKISENISLSVDLSGRQENRNFKPTGAIFTYMINRSKPIFIDAYPGNKPASGYEAGQNPIVLSSDLNGYDKRKNYYFQSNAKVLVTIPWVKNLSFTSNVSFDKDIYNSKAWTTPYMLYSWDRQTYDANKQPVVTGALSGPTLDPTLTQNMTDGQRIMMNALANYNFSIKDKHNIKVLAGAERITGESMNLMAFRRGFVSTALDELFAGADVAKDNSGLTNRSARLNYFGRLNYDFVGKYLFEFVFRNDGSYIFPEKGRFGFFPGISAGWVISKESFWKNNLSFINSFKLRGSWGQTGNDRIAEYQYLSSFGYGQLPLVLDGNVQLKTLNELRIANPNITWEVANQSNIGFDGELFGGKLQFSADYFYNLRTNILWFRNASVPASTGLTLPRENIGEVINKGFEAQLGYKDQIGSFNYQISGNISYAKNRIKFWDEVPGVPDYQRSTGQPMNAGLYYNAIGIFKDQKAVDDYPHWANARPGDIIFEDVNADGKINGLDMVRYSKTNVPTLTGGLSIDLGYKNFYASILFQGAAGAVNSYSLEAGKIGDFLADDADGRWTVDNPNATKPRTWNTTGEYWSTLNNTYWLKNTDYVRLKNLQLGYTIPKALSDRLSLNRLNIYFSGLNLLTFTSLKSFDPETVGTVYPLNKVYNFGIQVTF